VARKFLLLPSPKLEPSAISCEKDHTDLPENHLKQIEPFFTHYKDLEAQQMGEIVGWGEDSATAKKMLI